ncbi:hypothetical protein A6V27_20735 (plasmid) [Hafnia alvei]|nr:hypothetical protein A6V27_20735 [Hafnia alvei]
MTATGGTATAPGTAQKLTNLAAGTLSGTSTDAVNGSQLFATNTNVGTNATNLANLGTSTASALGGGATYNSTTGAWIAPSYTVQGSSYSNVGSALTRVDTGLSALNGGNAGLVQRTSTSNVATMTATGGTATAPGTAQKLTNLAAGTLSGTSTDAVNGSQLFATNTNVGTNATNLANLGTSTASALGGGAAYNSTTGAWTAPSYTVQGSSYSNIGDAFGGVDGSLTALTDSISEGTTGVVQRTDTANKAVLTAANGTAAAPGETQTLSNLTAGDLAADSTDAVNGSQLFATNTNVGTNATNLANLGTSTASALGGGAAYNSTTGAWTAPSYTVQGSSYSNIGDAFGGVDGSLTALTDSISEGTTGVVQRTDTANKAVLTAANGTAAAPGETQTLSNLTAGDLAADSTDAVNGSQLFATNTNVGTNTTNLANLGTSTASALGGGAAYNSSTGAWTAPSYTVQGSSYSNIGDAFGGVDDSLTALTDSISEGTTGVVQRTDTANKAVLTAANGTAAAPGETQTLSNLTAGDLAADSTDAVNGSQLFATNTNVGTNTTNLANLGTSTASALGGGAAYNSSTGAWTAPSYTVQGSSYSNIGDAFGGVDGSLTALTDSISEGTTGVVQRTDTANKAVLTAANGTAAAPGETQTLSNLTAGDLAADSTDAVNGSQLFATNTNVGTNTTNLANLGTSTASALGGGAAYNSSTGAWTAPSYTVQGSSYSNIGDAFGGVDGSLTALTDSISEGTTGVVQRTDTANKAVLTAANGTAAAPGETQTLSNLTAGDLAADSTDAVNGSQLFATNTNVGTNTTNLANLGTSTASALGGGAAYNSSTGAWTAPSYTVQGSSYSNIGDAFGGVDGSLTALTDSISEGTTGVVQRTDTANKAVLTAANGTAAAPGETQTLSNLTAGDLAADSTDAVNGSQLFATNTNVGTNTTNLANLGTSTASALGGGAAYNSTTGAWTAPSYTVQGSSYSNIGDAFGGVDGSLTALTDSISEGTTGVVQRTDTANKAVLTAANGTAAAPGETQTLSNLTAGDLAADSTDAVNGSQLFATNTNVGTNTTNLANLGTSTASALGGGAAYNSSTGAWTAPSYTVQGSSYSNIGDAFGGVDGSLTALTDSISEGTTGVVQRTDTANKAVLTAANGTAAAPGETQTLSNLTAGDLAADSTDAVNGSQLFATNTNVGTNTTNLANLGTSTASALGGGAAYNSTTGAWTAPSYTVQGSSYSNIGDAFGGVDSSLTALNNSVSSGSTGVVQRTSTANVATLTAAGGTASAPGEAQKLTNLAEGKLTADSTDAVNGSQLYAVADQVSKILPTLLA